MNTIAELIDRMFASRNSTHLEHLRTKSYARHVALAEFYDAIVDLTDSYVEAYQGNKGIVDTSGVRGAADSTDIETLLAANAAWVNANRAELSAKVSAIGNILDEIVSQHLSTLYKLKNLS